MTLCQTCTDADLGLLAERGAELRICSYVGCEEPADRVWLTDAYLIPSCLTHAEVLDVRKGSH